MKFFNLDLHISVIADIKNIFEELGHEVDDWSISGHSWVMGKEPKQVKIINQNTWRNIDENLADQFYECYKEELSKYDGFIVTHTPCFSLLYEKFEKPIIVVASTRYEEPFSNNMAGWYKFNNYLQNGIDNKQIIPISNNKYDSKYTELFTGREWQTIPSLCEYTNSKYTGKKDLFLYSSKFKSAMAVPKLVQKERELRSGYTWQELADYKGIVHVPYNASTMSIFEQYTSNIPLFFPNHDFLKDLRARYGQNGVMSELSWNQVFNHSSNSSIFVGLDDPNNYKNNDMMMCWTKLADFYDKENMPHIQHFGSIEHLSHLIDTIDTDEVSEKMRLHNIVRRKDVYDKWQNVLKQIS
mgnify:CR=1 FL=1|tara:strand:+ start:150 stop:1214 length:1065 start_codon:yes stop_codon:yes gene_type:complete